jgi:hypothetical protein
MMDNKTDRRFVTGKDRLAKSAFNRCVEDNLEQHLTDNEVLSVNLQVYKDQEIAFFRSQSKKGHTVRYSLVGKATQELLEGVTDTSSRNMCIALLHKAGLKQEEVAFIMQVSQSLVSNALRKVLGSSRKL